MIKILFVCHGNICRSPMAEFIMKGLIRKSEGSPDCLIFSAATSREEIGNDMYPPAKAILNRHGIPFEKRQARQVTAEDCRDYDKIIVMDDNNLRNFRRMFGTQFDDKLYKLMDFTTRGGNVADPWYTSDFETAYRDIEEGCRSLLERL